MSEERYDAHMEISEEVAIVISGGCLALIGLITERPDKAVEAAKETVNHLDKDFVLDAAKEVALTLTQGYLAIRESSHDD